MLPESSRMNMTFGNVDLAIRREGLTASSVRAALRSPPRKRRQGSSTGNERNSGFPGRLWDFMAAPELNPFWYNRQNVTDGIARTSDAYGDSVVYCTESFLYWRIRIQRLPSRGDLRLQMRTP